MAETNQVITINEDLENRLYNYKFEQALRYLSGEREEVVFG